MSGIPKQQVNDAQKNDIVEVFDKRPVIDISYLHKMSNNLSTLKKIKLSKQDGDCPYKLLEKFCYDVSKSIETMSDLFNCYSGKSLYMGSHESDRIKQIIKKAKSIHKEIELDNKLAHLHLKRNGAGKFVIHGIDIGNRFLILDLDPNHEFDK